MTCVPNSPTEGTEGRTAWSEFRRLIDGDQYVRANLVPDAWLAALAIANGARIATADAGYARFTGLEVVRPIG